MPFLTVQLLGSPQTQDIRNPGLVPGNPGHPIILATDRFNTEFMLPKHTFE